MATSWTSIHVTATFFACGPALERNPEAARAIVSAGHEICSHGYRWIVPSAYSRLLVEHGGFLYDSDSYADDVPYYVDVGGQSLLTVPYSLDVNDIKFWTTPVLRRGGAWVARRRDLAEWWLRQVPP